MQVPPKYFPYYISNCKDNKQCLVIFLDSCICLSVKHSKIETLVIKIVSMPKKPQNFDLLFS